jgi:hypothetical protein
LKKNWVKFVKIKSRKVQEIKQKLSCFINKRIFIANELRNADIEVEQIENLDGSKPHIVIRIKSIRKNRPVHHKIY